ncbi:MAG: hypothetical protein RL033_4730 [Pseudomonadota bacterium]
MRVASIVGKALLIVLGGYAASAAVSAGLALALARLGMDRGEAVVLSSLLGFLVLLGLWLWAFSWRRRTARAQNGTAQVTASQPSPSVSDLMSVLHTWAGMLLGAVLFAVFWMGTLTVFDREIDRWLMPATRVPVVAAPGSFDARAQQIRQLAPAQHNFSLQPPNARVPVWQLRWEEQGETVLRQVDPRSGEVVAAAGTLGATGFFFPFHFSLHIEWQRVGIWLVGLAGMALLVLAITGVVIHGHFFREFFTFRAHKSLSRSSLDLHTTLGVLALPFQLLMPLTGLVIFFSIFFPGTWQAAYGGDRNAFNRDLFGGYQRPKANQPAELGSLDAMAREATRRWEGGTIGSVRVRNAGDTAAVVEMRQSSFQQVALQPDPIFFDGVTGQVLAQFQSQPVARVQRFLSGMHFLQFDRWALRWLYFLAGLSGCVLCVTGFLFWLESRRLQQERQGLASVRVVECLTIGSVTGLVLATFAFFVANRALPGAERQWGLPREQLELWVFYAVWLLAFGHAALRARRAWSEQCWGIAGLALTAVLLNWLTTGDHVLRALARGVPAVAGVDALLLAGSLCAALVARRLQRALPATEARALRRQRAVLAGPAKSLVEG